MQGESVDEAESFNAGKSPRAPCNQTARWRIEDVPTVCTVCNYVPTVSTVHALAIPTTQWRRNQPLPQLPLKAAYIDLSCRLYMDMEPILDGKVEINSQQPIEI